MQLPLEGQPLHTRSLLIELSNAPDGLRVWGLVLDLRKASFVPMVEELQTAGLIHDMSLDLRRRSLDAHDPERYRSRSAA